MLFAENLNDYIITVLAKLQHFSRFLKFYISFKISAALNIHYLWELRVVSPSNYSNILSIFSMNTWSSNKMPNLLLFYNCGTALADIYDKTIKIQYIFSVLVI